MDTDGDMKLTADDIKKFSYSREKNNKFKIKIFTV